MTHPLWFAWPVSFAIVAGLSAGRLLRRGAGGSAGVAVVSAIVPVLPLTWALPVRCSDDSHSLGLRILPFGIGLLAVVAWLAILFALEVRAGSDRARADRRTRRAAALLVVGFFVEFAASGVTLEVACGGTDTPRVAHLAVAGIALIGTAGLGWWTSLAVSGR